MSADHQRDEERSILQLLAERTKLQREARPILDRIEQINTRLQAIFDEQNRRTMIAVGRRN
jgi:hemerythrin superfamily protein